MNELFREKALEMTFTISSTTSRRMQFYYGNTTVLNEFKSGRRINKKENENHHNGNENYV
jgi:hypothetical protein